MHIMCLLYMCVCLHICIYVCIVCVCVRVLYVYRQLIIYTYVLGMYSIYQLSILTGNNFD